MTVRLVRRHVPLLVALVAACRLYGDENEDAPPAPASVLDAGAALPAADAGTVDPGLLAIGDGGLESSVPDDGGLLDGGLVDAAPPRDLYVFISSKKISATISATQPEIEADRFCNDLARDQALLAGRRFAAWLSSTTPAKARILDKVAGRRYVRLDHLLVSSDPSRMAIDGLEGPITLTEIGTFHSTDFVWTGTSVAGSLTASTCRGWTSSDAADFGMAGLSSATNVTWTQFGQRSCDADYYLYCFEVP